MTISASSNPLSMLLDIFRSPTSCFLALYQRGLWGWQPFIVLMITPFLFWGNYFDMVDFAWLKAGLMQQMPASAAQQLAHINADALMATEIITDTVGRLVAVLMLGLWFLLATKGSEQQHGYWRWVAASCAILFPAVLGDIASFVSLILNHGHVMTYAADLNTLNGLIKLPMDHHWSEFARSLPLLMPWYIVLGYAAVGAWTTLERGQALAIAALPWVGYYLAWGLYLAFT